MDKRLKRFLEKFAAGSESACWIWNGYRDARGYGWFWTGKRADRAHRVAWEQANGKVPDGLCVCHHCDNPGCVNPAHLFLGTHGDNNSDRDRKGRKYQVRGEEQGLHKLTEDQVVEIRRRRAAGESTPSLARCFGVARTNISTIALNQTWRHVAA